MRSLKSFFKLGVILPLLSIQSVSADVLVWASDNRSGQPVRAEQAEWLRYLQTQSQGSNPLVTPTQAGLSQDYPLHLKPQADVGALMTSRLASGSDAALWVQLNPVGLDWVLELNGQAQQLRTPATSDGLSLGLSWLGMQLSMSAPVGTAQQPISASMPQPVVAAPVPAPVVQPATTSLPSAPMAQADGTRLSVGGVFDAADFLRLTQGVRALEGIDRVELASIRGTDVELRIVSNSLPPMQLQALLAQQPWLRRTDAGDLRWDALALPLPGATPNSLNAEPVAAQALVQPTPQAAQ